MSGEWKLKPIPVMSKNARKRIAANAPKRKFATIDGERKEIRQTPAKELRPYPSAPVTARPGSRVAATVMRGYVESIPHLPYRRIGAEPEVGRRLSKADQANHIPFMPEFQAEGQPFPRISRDKDGNAVPRVRTDNGMTKQLQGRGIGKAGKLGLDAYSKRQRAAIEAERKARVDTALEVDRLRGLVQAQEDSRAGAKRDLQAAMGREREALARGDMAAAEAAREDVRRFRKAAKHRA